MKIIGCFITIVFLYGCIVKDIGSGDPMQSKQKKNTFILAQIDSISQDKCKVFFTPIIPYSTFEFKAIRVDSDEKLEDNCFYKKLIQNNFFEGEMFDINVLKKIKKNELYLLSINVLNSKQDRLIIDYIIKPNKVKFSSMIKLK